MDYNNQNPYEQSSNTQTQSTTQGQNPYQQSSSTQQGQNPYQQSSNTQQGQNPYYQSSTQQQGQNPYYQQNPYQQPSYQQPQYQSYQTYQNPGNMEEPMSVKEWLITDLLMLIPCVNFILVFVWAFSSSEKKSKSNYFKANLIFAGCILAFYLIIVIILVAMGVAFSFS